MGASQFRTSDRLVLRATGSVPVRTASDRKHITDWFTTVIPEIESHDKLLSELFSCSLTSEA